MRRLLCVVVALASFVPVAGRASHCASSIVVFSRNDAQRTAGTGAVNSNAIVCEVAVVEGADSRLLVPLATEITVRYTRDLTPGVPTLTAFVSGMGFSDAPLSLARVADPTTGLFSYRSAATMIPAGETGSGVIRVRIVHGAIPGGIDQVCFRTWDASC